MGISSAVTKKGSQQMTKAPVMMARVLAAFFSLFASRVSFLDFFGASFGSISSLDTSDTWEHTESAPLLEDLSGEAPLAAVVKAVVC